MPSQALAHMDFYIISNTFRFVNTFLKIFFHFFYSFYPFLF